VTDAVGNAMAAQTLAFNVGADLPSSYAMAFEEDLRFMDTAMVATGNGFTALRLEHVSGNEARLSSSQLDGSPGASSVDGLVVATTGGRILDAAADGAGGYVALWLADQRVVVTMRRNGQVTTEVVGLIANNSREDDITYQSFVDPLHGRAFVTGSGEVVVGWVDVQGARASMRVHEPGLGWRELIVLNDAPLVVAERVSKSVAFAQADDGSVHAAWIEYGASDRSVHHASYMNGAWSDTEHVADAWEADALSLGAGAYDTAAIAWMDVDAGDFGVVHAAIKKEGVWYASAPRSTCYGCGNYNSYFGWTYFEQKDVAISIDAQARTTLFWSWYGFDMVSTYGHMFHVERQFNDGSNPVSGWSAVERSTPLNTAYTNQDTTRWAYPHVFEIADLEGGQKALVMQYDDNNWNTWSGHLRATYAVWRFAENSGAVTGQWNHLAQWDSWSNNFFTNSSDEMRAPDIATDGARVGLIWERGVGVTDTANGQHRFESYVDVSSGFDSYEDHQYYHETRADHVAMALGGNQTAFAFMKSGELEAWSTAPVQTVWMGRGAAVDSADVRTLRYLRGHQSSFVPSSSGFVPLYADGHMGVGKTFEASMQFGACGTLNRRGHAVSFRDAESGLFGPAQAVLLPLAAPTSGQSGCPYTPVDVESSTSVLLANGKVGIAWVATDPSLSQSYDEFYWSVFDPTTASHQVSQVSQVSQSGSYPLIGYTPELTDDGVATFALTYRHNGSIYEPVLYFGNDAAQGGLSELPTVTTHLTDLAPGVTGYDNNNRSFKAIGSSGRLALTLKVTDVIAGQGHTGGRFLYFDPALGLWRAHRLDSTVDLEAAPTHDLVEFYTVGFMANGDVRILGREYERANGSQHLRVWRYTPTTDTMVLEGTVGPTGNLNMAMGHLTRDGEAVFFWSDWPNTGALYASRFDDLEGDFSEPAAASTLVNNDSPWRITVVGDEDLLVLLGMTEHGSQNPIVRVLRGDLDDLGFVQTQVISDSTWVLYDARIAGTTEAGILVGSSGYMGVFPSFVGSDVVTGCGSSPCSHGGVCSEPTAGTFACDCSGTGYGGATCATDLDECLTNPCAHGTCVNMPGTFTCDCDGTGYGGATCATDVDECQAGVCKNGAACTNTTGGFTCACTAGWDGATCEVDIDECQNSPCDNGGECIDLDGGFFCDCVDGWTGATCETDLDTCTLLSPCANGGACTNVVGGSGYSCDCSGTGFAGSTCAVDVDECALNPCKNGGVCQNQVGSYVCQCVGGFGGATCEVDGDQCGAVSCGDGTCIDLYGDYTCDCTGTGAMGRHCEVADPCEGSCNSGGQCAHAPFVKNALADRNTPIESPWSLTIPSDTFGDLDLVFGDVLTVTATSLPDWVTYDEASATLSGTPSSAGTNTITLTATDTSQRTATDTFTITVTAQNTPPLARADSYAIAEDSGAHTFDVLANDSDPEAQSLSITGVAVALADGTATVVDQKVVYTPAADRWGTVRFTYTLSDGTTSASGQVTVQIAPLDDDPPTAGDDSVVLAPDTTDNVIEVLLNDSSAPDRPEEVVLVAVSSSSAGASVSLGASGDTVLYSPPPGFRGTDTFTYTIADQGGLEDIGVVTVTVLSNPLEADASPPMVVAVHPMATTVMASTDFVWARFSEELEPATMDTSRFVLERCAPDCVAIDTTLEAHEGAWVLKPTAPLLEGAYQARVLAGYEDTQGNQGAAWTWTFTVSPGFSTPVTDMAAPYSVPGVKSFITSAGQSLAFYIESIADNESHLMMATRDGTTTTAPRALHVAIGTMPTLLDVAEGQNDELYVFWTAGDRYYLTHVDGDDVETAAVALDDDGQAGQGAGRVVVKANGQVVFVWLDDGYAPYAIRSRTLLNGVYSAVTTLAAGQVEWFDYHERGLALEVTDDTIHLAWVAFDGSYSFKTMRHGSSGWSTPETVAANIAYTNRRSFSAASPEVAAMAWVEPDGSGYGMRIWSAIRNNGVWHKTSRATCNCFAYDAWSRPEPLGVAIVAGADGSAVLAWNYVGSYDATQSNGYYNYDQRVWFASQAYDGSASPGQGWSTVSLQEAWSYNGMNYGYNASSGDHVLLGRRAGDTAVFVANYWHDTNNDALLNGEPQVAVGSASLTENSVTQVAWYPNVLSYSNYGSSGGLTSLGQVAFAATEGQMLFASDLGVVAAAPSSGSYGNVAWYSPADMHFNYDVSDTDESFAYSGGQYGVAVADGAGMVTSVTTLGYTRVSSLPVTGYSMSLYDHRVHARAAARDHGLATNRGQKLLSGADGTLARVRTGNYQFYWSSRCSGTLEEPLSFVTRRDPETGLWSPNAVVGIDYQMMGFNLSDWFNNCHQWGGISTPNNIVAWDAELMGDKVAVTWLTDGNNGGYWQQTDAVMAMAVDTSTRTSWFGYQADWGNTWSASSPVLDMAVDGERIAAAVGSSDGAQYSRVYLFEGLTTGGAQFYEDYVNQLFYSDTAAFGGLYTTDRTGFGAGHGELVWGALVNNSSSPYDMRLRIALRDASGWVSADWERSTTSQPHYDTVLGVFGEGRVLEPGWGRIAAMVSDGRGGATGLAACDHIRDLGVECNLVFEMPPAIWPSSDNVKVLESGLIAALWYDSAREVIHLQVGEDSAEITGIAQPVGHSVMPRLSIDAHGGVVVAWQERNAAGKSRVRAALGSVVGPTLSAPFDVPVPTHHQASQHLYLQESPVGGASDGAMLGTVPEGYNYWWGSPQPTSYRPACTAGCPTSCGDGVCQGAEDDMTCPSDCAGDLPRFGFVMDGPDGAELAVSSCSAVGTEMVDLGAGPASPQQLTPWRGGLVFSAVTPEHGRELWRHDRNGKVTRLTDLGVGVGRRCARACRPFRR
jgi:hypothetical protein